MSDRLDILVLGLSITSSWGNGHATTYRGLIRELNRRGHRVQFLERDVPWYSTQRDLPNPPYCETELYRDLRDLQDRFERRVKNADLVVVGSYVPQGVAVGEWVTRTARGITAFYDIDTPVTLAKLARGDFEYLAPSLIPDYDLYLSFSGGRTLDRLEREYGSPKALPLYCSFDPELYYPDDVPFQWDLAYMGTYSDDRQPTVDALLRVPAEIWSAGKFAVAGPQYPSQLSWPDNVQRIEHLPPAGHRAFYNAQRFTLNVTRKDMIAAGYSPSVRLFEAAACGTPIISDFWEGLDEFFKIGEEIFVAKSADDVLGVLKNTSEVERKAMGERALRRVLSEHTAAHRAAELESYVLSAKKAEASVI